MKFPFWRSATPKTRPNRRTLEVLSLESREVPALNPTGAEQEMLELLNHMRTDPQGHFSRMVSSVSPLTSPDADVQGALNYFQVNGSTLRNQWNSLTPVQPVAWNESLVNAANGHNQAMIAADQQSHQVAGELSLSGRVEAAGYTGWSNIAENIYAYSENSFYAHAGFAIDWGGSSATGGIQSPPGHRNNMMSNSYREVGIRITNETNPATDVGPQVVTQDFGNRFALSNGGYLLGVVYNDLNSNQFYNAGEGLGGVNVTITSSGGFNRTLTSMDAGGYQTFLSPGTYSVTYSGGGLSTPVTRSVTIGTANVKVDILSNGTGGGGGGNTVTNSAPVLNTAITPVLAPVASGNSSPIGIPVSSLIAGAVTDANSTNSIGIAVTASGVTTGGFWQYSTDNGNTWSNFGALSATSARLLASDDQVRFLPIGSFAGAVTLSYKAWDGTTGTAGQTANAALGGTTTAFSTATKAITVRVQTAPTLNPALVGTPARISEDNTNPPSIAVSTLLGTGFTDPNSNTVNGIAITGLSNSGNGTWQYRTSGSATWLPITGVTNANALLLRGIDFIRFVPAANFHGTVSVSFRAWDRSQGTLAGRWDVSHGTRVGGGTAFSTASATVSHTILPVNDAPVLNTTPIITIPNVNRAMGSTSQSTVAALLGSNVTDVDGTSAAGIAVIGATQSSSYRWEYSTDGGSTWVAFGSVSSAAARLLRTTDLVRVRTLTNVAAPITVRLSYRAWDGTTGTAGGVSNLSTSAYYGGRTAFSALYESATTTVG